MTKLRAASPQRRPRRRNFLRETKSAYMLEFAICAPIFLALMMMVFEIAYDLFLQEVMDSSLHTAAAQLQDGNTQTYLNGTTPTGMDGPHFITNYLCPATFGFLSCGGLFVRLEVINTTTCPDLYTATSGVVPASGGALQLGSYVSQTGTGNGSQTPNNCDSNNGNGFCLAGPSELILISAIYIGPSFINGLLPSTTIYTYSGSTVRAQLSTEAFETEPFTVATVPGPNGTQPVTTC